MVLANPEVVKLGLGFLGGIGTGAVGFWKWRYSSADSRSEQLFKRYERLHDDCEERNKQLSTKVDGLLLRIERVERRPRNRRSVKNSGKKAA